MQAWWQYLRHAARKMKLIFGLLILSIMGSPSAMAVDTKIALAVEPVQVVLGEAAVVQIQLSGDSSAQNLHLFLPNNWKCHGRSQQSSTRIINGQISRQLQVDCTFFPDQAGEFELGPASINVQGSTIKSNTVKLKVIADQGLSAVTTTDDDQQAGAAPAPGPNASHGAVPSSPNPPPGVGKERPFAWVASISQNEVYYGTPLVYTLRFWHQKDQVTPEELAPPQFAGFWFEKTLDAQLKQEVKDGKVWQVFAWQYLLIPEKEGELEIPGTTISGSVATGEEPDLRQMFLGRLDRFFNQGFSGFATRPFQLKANPVKVKVLPLPPPPAGVVAQGLVGSFTATAQVDKTSAQQGDSLTYTITLAGTGNFTDAKISLPENPAFKFYEDKAQTERQIVGGQLQGKKVFRWAVVPVQAGKLTLPAQTIWYFDLASKTYKSTTTQSIALEITPSANPVTSVVRQHHPAAKNPQVEMLGEDLMPLKLTMATPLSERGGKYFALLMAVYLLGLPLWRLGRGRWLQVKAGRSYVQHQAWKTFLAQTRSLAKSKKFAEQLALAWGNYLAVIFEQAAVTSFDLPQLAATYHLKDADVKALAKLLQQLDAARYGGEPIDPAQYKACLKESTALATRLLKSLK